MPKRKAQPERQGFPDLYFAHATPVRPLQTAIGRRQARRIAMYSLHWSARRGGKVVDFAARALPYVAFILVVGAMSWGAAVGQIVQIAPFAQRDRLQVNEGNAVAGVYLPTDRALSRAITRARERIGEQEYHESLAFLHGILGRDEDSFIERSADDREQLGLKATARKMIGDLPAAGIDAYELLQGPTARRQLEAALKEGDRDSVAKVVRQFFHTTAGYEATLVLAQMEADQGHRLAAAQLFQDLIDTPRAAARFDPQLSIAAALNQLAAGRPEEAANTIRGLVERKPSAEISINGKKVAIPAAGSDPLAWLINVAGTMKALSPAALNWLTMHGDPSRNIESPGGQPHLRPRWEARVVNEPTIESYLTSRMNDFLQRNVVAIPGARPIAVGDVVIMRTPENVVAVDWQTGKRVWETRDEQELETEEAPADLAPGIDHDQLIAQGKPLEERMWDDALATAISSDGAHVFVVRGLPVARDEESFPWQINPGFGRAGVETAAATNQLAAYDIATQGKLAWELDGARTTGPLAGAFFLGPPLAIDNTLFVMAEIRSAVYLVALNPATGHVEWQQQLVGLEQGILVDPARRRVGASPSYSGGILICPTGASAAVAIDVVKREFAWVYRYAREAQSQAETRQIWQQQQMQAQLVRANDQWLDSSAIIADNHVLITPPESAEIHCIDLHSGKLAWKKRQGDALFIGGVDRGNVLLVGSQSIQGVRLSDGAAAWKQESVSLPAGVLPAGQGYLSEGHYFLPLTSGQIAEIEMATGKITNNAPASPDVMLGNLICYRGSIVSQSPLLLDKFEQLEMLQKRTEAALAKNPDDTTALRELAEINGAAGKKAEAVRMLKRAYELAPDDPVTQEMLVELLLQQLASDYAANRADVPLVAKLIHGRDQQIELLRIDATGLDALDQKGAAWDAYLRLADFTAEEPAYLRVNDRYNVRSDRWTASRLGAIWSQASADDRKPLEDKIAARRPSLKKPLTAAEMRHYLAHMGELPGADDVRLALASFLVDRGRAQEAEIELLQLVNVKSPDDASRIATELLAKLDAKANERNATRHVKWPMGKVESKVVTTAVPNNNERMARAPMERQNGYRQLRIEQDYWPAESDLQWFVAMDSSELVGRNSLGEDVYHLAIDTTTLPRTYRANAGLVHGASLGHLLFVTVGGQVMAIDSRQDSPDAEGDLLWPSRALEELSAEAGRTRRGLPPAPTRPTRPPVYHNLSGRQRVNGSAGSASGSLGPVTPRGVVFQDSEELKCVDPLSGLLLWTRTDVPAGCELFGDDEFVFAGDVGNHEAYVVRISDGELVGKREAPRSEWLLTTGRNLAQLNFSLKQITVTDIWTQKSVYQGKFPENMRLAVIEPNAIAVFDPTGKFQVLDVATGKMLIDTTLEPISELQGIVTMRAGDDLFLFVTSQVQQQQFKPIGQPSEFPLINGLVYAFSLKTGEPLWPSPALVRNRGVVLQQPRDIPFLVFADRQMQRDAMNGSGSQLRVLCLDRRTGQTVYRNDAIPETAVVRFRIRGEADSQPVVAVEMGTSKIQLTMTDTPRPPQPPGNDDLEAPREIVERGLPAIGQRMWGAFRGAMEKPVPGPVQRQPQQVLPQQPNPRLQQQPQQPEKPAEAPPKPKVDPEFDDD